jgi:hypothetical protein
MEIITKEFVAQAPGIAGIIVVVILFLRSIKERDVIFHAMIKDLTHEIAALKTIMLECSNQPKRRIKRKAPA